MLADKDRIFTNLYGLNTRDLKGAKSRGAWDGTGRIIKRGRDWVVEEVKKSGLRGAWGCGLSDGIEMVVYAERIRWSPVLPGRQCR